MTVQALVVRAPSARRRMDVHYWQAGIQVDRRYAAPRYPLVELGDLVELVQYGTSKRANEDPTGTPILRMNNLQNDGWDLSDVKFVQLDVGELERYRLEQGDILFNRTNGSRELVGKCEVFREEGEWVFASYLIRVRVNTDLVLPDYVAAFLNTWAGRSQVERVSRQILMSNINTAEIRQLKIPLPPISMQRKLVAELGQAFREREARLGEADELLEGLSGYIGDRLGLALESQLPNLSLAVKRSALLGRRLDAAAHRQPRSISEGSMQTRRLDELAVINPRRYEVPQGGGVDLVPYVGLPDCTLTQVRRVSMRPIDEVRGRSAAEVGDILFARIEPSVFNKKYVFVDDLRGHGYAYTSGEFYVVRSRQDRVVPSFLYAMFFSSFVHRQVVGKTTGSSGRRRIDRELFASLEIPYPVRSEQEEIAAEVESRREQAARLREEAQAFWSDAKTGFENRVLGVNDSGGRE